MKEIELSKHGTVNKGKYKALVDDDVFEKVNKFDWHYSNGYAVRTDRSTDKQKQIKLHRFIWELKVGEIPDDKELEHIDENGLNDQISNLRLATHSENICNITKRKDNKSGVKGIHKKVDKKKYKDKLYTYEKWYASVTKDVGKKTEKTYAKKFPYTDEGFAQAKEWIKQKTEELHKEFSIYNKDK